MTPSNDFLINITIAYITSLFASNSGGHDVEHTLRVYRNAMRIAAEEQGCDELVVALAALLHDVDDHKLFQTENYENARHFLEANGLPEETVEAVIGAIDSVSFSQNQGRVPETLEGKIVQDADRLDAMGAVGIARTFAYGGEHGRPMEASVQHFYDKLLRLRDLMNTESARRIAEERHAFLVAYLEEFRKETEE